MPSCLHMQGTGRFHPVLRVLCFSLYWVLSAPTWLALWAFFTGSASLLLRWL